MSQWGKPKRFRFFWTVIWVTPHVDTPTWQPISGSNIIDSMHLTDVQGNERVAAWLMKRLTRKYVGKYYWNWSKETKI